MDLKRMTPDAMGLRLGALWALRKTGVPMASLHRLILGSRVAPGFRAGAGSCVVARDVRIERDVSIGRNVDIAAEEVFLGEGAVIGDNVTVRCRRFHMGPGSRIDHRTVVYGLTTPQSGFELGEEAWVYSDCHLNTDERITIGARTAAGSHCLIFTHSHYLAQTRGYPVKVAPVRIGSDTWLPWHAFILPGTTIGNGATVGAFSLVGGDVPDDSLAVGVPAKIVKDAAHYRRRYTEDELIVLGRKMCREVVVSATQSFRPRSLFFPLPRDTEDLAPGVVRVREAAAECFLIYEPDAAAVDLDRMSSDPARCLFVETRQRALRTNVNTVHLTDLRARFTPDAQPLVLELASSFSRFGIRFPRKDWVRS